MKGFLNANYGYKFNGNSIFDDVKPTTQNRIMELAGFTIDRKNGIYVKEGFGAFSQNLDKQIKSIDDLRTFISEATHSNYYQEFVDNMDNKGYVYVLGPSAPDIDGNPVPGYGLYCKNYKEIIKNQEAENNKKEQQQEI